GPFAFDRGPPFQLEAEFAKEIDRRSEVFDDDADVVHPLERHVSNLQGQRIPRGGLNRRPPSERMAFQTQSVSRGADVDERDAGGYSITYGGEEIEAPVYVVAFLAAILLAAGLVTGGTLWLALGVAAAGITYYNVPLLERRPTMGANQYGIFIQGL